MTLADCVGVLFSLGDDREWELMHVDDDVALFKARDTGELREVSSIAVPLPSVVHNFTVKL